MGARTQTKIHHHFIITLIIFSLVATIIFGLELYPDVNFNLPFTYQMQLYIALTMLVSGIFFALFSVEYHDNAAKGARVEGFTVYAVFSLIGALIGLGLTGFMLLTDYDFVNPEMNKWISAYLFLGGFTIFILGRGFIFLYREIEGS